MRDAGSDATPTSIHRFKHQETGSVSAKECCWIPNAVNRLRLSMESKWNNTFVFYLLFLVYYLFFWLATWVFSSNLPKKQYNETKDHSSCHASAPPSTEPAAEFPCRKSACPTHFPEPFPGFRPLLSHHSPGLLPDAGWHGPGQADQESMVPVRYPSHPPGRQRYGKTPGPGNPLPPTALHRINIGLQFRQTRASR